MAGTVNREELIGRLREKPDIQTFVDEVTANAEMIPLLLDVIRNDRSSVKFLCEKIIRRISEKQPLLIYPHFEELAALLTSANSFIKWGATMTLANLIEVDSQNKFDVIYQDYFALLNSDSMVTACNAAGNAWRFVHARPDYEADLTSRLLATENNTYLYQGKPSAECKNILLGTVIDSFSQYYDRSVLKNQIHAFVTRQSQNTRKQVAKKALAFLAKFKLDLA